jgi:anhydro-N-acetylmuramic acid kinase
MVPLKAIGLMSGTSLDGVDAALLETDGIRLSHTGPSIYSPYPPPERDLSRRALADASALFDRAPGSWQAERVVTQTNVETVERRFEDHRIDRTEIAIVGFHGQTELHRPASGLTVVTDRGWHSGSGTLVAYDFRAADMAAGG